MTRVAVAGLVVAAVVVGFYLYVALRALLRRPRPVRPAAPTPDLREEPPAVVNVLVHSGQAPQVASATVLDLAARRVVELIEVADDRDHTLVRVRGPVPDQLAPYEQRVLDRLRRVAGDTAVPVREVVERYAEGAHHWRNRLERDALLEARKRGLLARSDKDVGMVALFVAGIAVAGLLSPLVPLEHLAATSLALVAFWVPLTIVAWLLLWIPVTVVSHEPDRLTAKGRQAAAHWLGVAAWLRAHDPLRDLPPAAVAVWDRYLAYGAALDTMPHAVRILDLERVGRRDVLWSHHTGQWRSVRVRYPRGRSLLRPLGSVAAQASLIWAVPMTVLWAVAGLLLLVADFTPYLRVPLLTLAAVQLARSGYRVVRSMMDLAAPARVTGTLLDIGVGASNRSADYVPEVDDVPNFYYMVVDDGTSDEVRPWLVNRDLAGARYEGMMTDLAERAKMLEGLMHVDAKVGDTVLVEGQRRSRYATAFSLVSRAPSS